MTKHLGKREAMTGDDKATAGKLAIITTMETKSKMGPRSVCVRVSVVRACVSPPKNLSHPNKSFAIGQQIDPLAKSDSKKEE